MFNWINSDNISYRNANNQFYPDKANLVGGTNRGCLRTFCAQLFTQGPSLSVDLLFSHNPLGQFKKMPLLWLTAYGWSPCGSEGQLSFSP